MLLQCFSGGMTTSPGGRGIPEERKPDKLEGLFRNHSSSLQRTIKKQWPPKMATAFFLVPYKTAKRGSETHFRVAMVTLIQK